MVLASIFFAGSAAMSWMMLYPLAIGGICIPASIAGTFFVKLGPSNNIMGALYRGFVVSAVLSLVGILLVTWVVVGFGGSYTVGGGSFSGLSLFLCGVSGLVVTGLLIWVTEYYTGTELPAGAVGRPGLDHRPRHQRDPGPRDLDGIDRDPGADHLRRHHRHLPAGRPVRHRHRGHQHAGAGRHGRGARRLRPGHRQCRRHRRDGRPAGGGPGHHRRARRRRQHHQGGDQGLCHRLRRPRRAGAVRGLHLGPELLHLQPGRAPVLPGPGARFLPGQPLRRGRPADRRPAALSVRRDGHDRGRPRRRIGGGGGAPPVPRGSRHHGRHQPAGLQARGRHADQGGDPRDDRAVAAAGAGADRAVLRDRGDRRPRRRRSPRSGRCCSASSSPGCSSPSR